MQLGPPCSIKTASGGALPCCHTDVQLVQPFPWHRRPCCRPAGLAAYTFGQRLDLSGVPAAVLAQVETDQYKLDRQAMATRVQERSNMPAMTLPIFEEAEVQAAVILTANCVGMAAMLSSDIHTWRQHIMQADAIDAVDRSVGPALESVHLPFLSLLWPAHSVQPPIAALVALSRTLMRKAGNCQRMAPRWWPAPTHSKQWR